MNFLSQLCGELRKLYARPRTYLGYMVFLLMEILILVVFKLKDAKGAMRALLERNNFNFEQFYSATTVTYWIMGLSMALLGSIYFALVAGDIVAKESEDGNLRLVLARPISRFRILALKYAAVCIYTVSFVFFVGITGYLMAIAAVGSGGGLWVWSPDMKVFSAFNETREAVQRIALAACGISISMITLSSLAFMFSCFRIKPASAAIATLSVLFVDFVLQRFPFFSPYIEYFVTWRMSCWVYLLENVISWPKIASAYVFLGGLNLTLFLIGYAAFRLRDFKT